MSDKTSSGGQGIGLGIVLFLIFLVLKLTGTIAWSWWWVTSPLWIPWAILLTIFAIAIPLGVARGWRVESEYARYERATKRAARERDKLSGYDEWGQRHD